MLETLEAVVQYAKVLEDTCGFGLLDELQKLLQQVEWCWGSAPGGDGGVEFIGPASWGGGGGGGGRG